jgi:hypothetical protein
VRGVRVLGHLRRALRDGVRHAAAEGALGLQRKRAEAVVALTVRPRDVARLTRRIEVEGAGCIDRLRKHRQQALRDRFGLAATLGDKLLAVAVDELAALELGRVDGALRPRDQPPGLIGRISSARNPAWLATGSDAGGTVCVIPPCRRAPGRAAGLRSVGQHRNGPGGSYRMSVATLGILEPCRDAVHVPRIRPFIDPSSLQSCLPDSRKRW